MNLVSLYSGCGGLDLGFHAAGFRTIWANEISPDACETLRSEFWRIGAPIRQIECGDIREMGLPDPENADIVIGGPPCQGFSVAGRMDPNDPRSRHVWEFFRVVKELQPRAFVMENVKALGANTRWKSTRKALIQRGEELGYSTRLLLLNAADYGVPQLRERMFLVGIRGGCVMPTPTPTEQRISVRDALRDLPPYGHPGNASSCGAIITPARNPVMRKSPFAGMLFNGQGRPIDLEQPAPTLPASMGGNRTPIIDQESLETGTEPWIAQYHRHLIAGGAPYSKVPPRLRRLTVEEAAALQGFSPGMKFSGSQCAKFRQIGNSVPPPLAKAVAETILSTLKSEGTRIEWQGGQSVYVLEEAAKYDFLNEAH